MTQQGNRRTYRYQSTAPLILGQTRSASRIKLPAWLFALVLGLAVVAVAVVWFWYTPNFRVASLEVSGAQRVAAADILAVSDLEGLHVLAVDEEAVAARLLEEFPSLEGAEVSCQLPAECAISVAEHPVKLSWVTEDGLVYWVDAAGQIVPAGQTLDQMWVIEGPLALENGGSLDMDVLTALIELESLGYPPQTFGYRVGRGLYVLDMGWRVILGEGAGMGERLSTYALVRGYLQEHGIQPQFVDVRFPSAPYYSTEEPW